MGVIRMLRLRTLAVGVALAALVVAVGSVWAATINGTAGKDTLRGTAASDTLNGKGGNDRLYGLGGSDTLIGGVGNDLLVGGAGADTLRCGAGRDTAVRDRLDKVAKDCEVVRGPSPTPAPTPTPTPTPTPSPTPTPTPVTPVAEGAYKGLIDGNFLFFSVANRAVTGFRTNYIREDCNGGVYVYGTMDFGTMRFPIETDGTFRFVGDSKGTIDNDPATFHDELAGSFSGTNASGTLLESSEFDYQGTHYTCTSGQRPWTATLQP